jgi:hypothetical protein
MELKSLLEKFLGEKRTEKTLEEYAHVHNIDWKEELTADTGLVRYTEKLLAGAIGSASALVMVTSVVKEEPIGFDEILHSDSGIDPDRHKKFTGIIITESG